MGLPNLELKAGEKGEITLSLGSLSPFRKEVLQRLLSAQNLTASTPTLSADVMDRLIVFVYQTGQPRTFKINRIRAIGVRSKMPACYTWGADRFFPCIDAFGQFKHADWPGKIHAKDDLKKALEQERNALSTYREPSDRSLYGGWTQVAKSRVTGRFRVVKVDGKWWFIDPEGYLWWSHGVEHVDVAEGATRVDGQKDFFETLPDVGTPMASFYQTVKGKRSYAFAAANASLKYGESWREALIKQAQQRLRSWGVNTIGADSAAEITAGRKIPYMKRLTLTSPCIEGPGDAASPVIDPYAPTFKAEVARQMAICKVLNDDPWCAGIGVDSGIGKLRLVNLGRAILQAPAQQPAKIKMVQSLTRQYGTIERLNAKWKTSYLNWDGLLKETQSPRGATYQDCSTFAEQVATLYFKEVEAAFKAMAPDTLNLGCLLSVPDPVLMRLSGWHADVVSVVQTGKTLETFEISPYLERPVLIVMRPSETDGVGVFNPFDLNTDGAKAWGNDYTQHLTVGLQHPNVVGVHACQYAEGCLLDNPRDNGLVDVCDTPDAERVEVVRQLSNTLYPTRANYSRQAKVTVDLSQSLGPRREIERYINNSILMRSPPLELARVIEKEYGRAKIVRCWVCLDDLWDIKTGEYTFNYPIKNRVKGGDADYEMQDVPFETYLRTYGGIADEVLLNVRRLERHVVEGKITMAQWKEVCKTALKRYKTICPNLRYIEALNEFHLSAFGNLNTKEYYEFYKTVYQVVNELNAELKPALPLLVGGPATTGVPPDYHLRQFVALYAADVAPDKRLDFLSYHYYGDRKWNEAAQFETRMTELLDAHQIPSEIPMFWDEMGFTGSPWKLFPVARDLNRLQATCVTAFQYHSRKNRKLQILPWVTFHSPSQTALTQFLYAPDGTLRMSPFGMTVKCWGMQKRNEVASDSTGLDEEGGGLGAMGSVDESGAAVLFWNHQSWTCEVNLDLHGLSETLLKGWRGRRYLIDSRHSNCYRDLTQPVALDMVEDANGSGPALTRRFVLEPYAVSLLLIEPLAAESSRHSLDIK